jgi:hypothetical protein
MNAMTTHSDELARLKMDARYHRERRDLYRAKSYGRHATSPERLRELERTSAWATERLEVAEARAKEAAVAPGRDGEP